MVVPASPALSQCRFPPQTTLEARGTLRLPSTGTRWAALCCLPELGALSRLLGQRVKVLMDAVGIEKAIIHSFDSAREMAMVFAAQYPERVFARMSDLKPDNALLCSERDRLAQARNSD